MAEARGGGSGARPGVVAWASGGRAAGWPEPSAPAGTAQARGLRRPYPPAPRLVESGVLLDGVPVSLTAREHALMTVLARRPGRAWGRSELARTVYAEELGSEVVIDVLVAALRRKLRRVRPDREWIGTIDGTAYAFVG